MGGGKGGSGKGGNREKKGEISSSPQSFEEAWDGSFFLDKAKSEIRSRGLNLSDIPCLHLLPLGGRLRLAAKNWGVIDPSEWVYSTILEGYKIPFEMVPVQTFVGS